MTQTLLAHLGGHHLHAAARCGRRLRLWPPVVLGEALGGLDLWWASGGGSKTVCYCWIQRNLHCLTHRITACGKYTCGPMQPQSSCRLLSGSNMIPPPAASSFRPPAGTAHLWLRDGGRGNELLEVLGSGQPVVALPLL